MWNWCTYTLGVHNVREKKRSRDTNGKGITWRGIPSICVGGVCSGDRFDVCKVDSEIPTVNESAMDEEEQQVLKLHSPNRVEQVSYKWPLLRNVSCIESGRLEIFSGCWMVLGHSRRSDRDYRHHQVVRAPCWAHWLRFEIDFMPTCWYFYDCAQMGV